MKILFISLFVLFCLQLSGLDVIGEQYGTWSVENSPYNVIGSITIPVGESLIIEPGVEAVFHGFYRITAYGIIEAVGTEADSVYFYGYSDTQWDRIRLENTSESSLFEYCSFSNADETIYSIFSPFEISNSEISNCTVGIRLFGIGQTNLPHIHIHNNRIYNCQQNGIMIAEYSNVIIEYNEVFQCALSGQPRGAIQLSNQSAGGSNSPVIRNNHIHNNTWQGITAWDLASAGAINPQIEDNLIEYNLTGIYLINTGGVIRNNIISNNFVTGNPDSGAGVMLNGASTFPYFISNEITGNFTGFYLIQGATAMLGNIDVDHPDYVGMNHIYNNVGPDGNINSVYSLSSADIMAQNNVWDSEDYDEIANTIHDGHDQAGLGYVIFDPIYVLYDLLPPEELTAEAGNQQVFLSWLPPDAEEEVLAYNIYRDNNIIYENITDTFYLDEGLVNGVEYEYFVTAIYSQGESEPSNIVFATPFQSVPGLVINPIPEDGAIDVSVFLKIISWTYEALDSTFEPDYFSVFISVDEDQEELIFHSTVDFEQGVEDYFINKMQNVKLEYNMKYFWKVHAVVVDENTGEEIINQEQTTWSFTTKEDTSDTIIIVPEMKTKMVSITPNPLRKSISSEVGINFFVNNSKNVVIDIFNIRGQRVAQVYNDIANKGNHRFVWQINNHLNNGIYFVQMRTDNYIDTKKFILIK